MSSKTMSPIGTLYFPKLFTPGKPKTNPNAPLRYSLMLLFDQRSVETTAYAELRRAIIEAVAEKFGPAKAADPAFLRGLRMPVRPASEKTYGGFENGVSFISPWSNGEGANIHQPDVMGLRGERIIDPSAVFAGQLARCTVRPFAYDSNGNRGVSLGLDHVQIVKADMPRLDGRQSGDQAFKNADNSELAALGIDPNAPQSFGGGASSGFAVLDDADIPF
jgi:hypothetical protein